ncbi:hypothetical protein, partial [Klebsiella pneumoniae]|uniref:hypothetical protein n=1 Tax=Klebsiella pneumoniae TaxID=573 RepID=UPI00187DE08E
MQNYSLSGRRLGRQALLFPLCLVLYEFSTASLHAVQGGRNRAGDQGGKPRGLMCSSATLAGFFDLSDASGPPWALLDLLLLFLDVLLLLVLLLVA